MLSSAGVSFDLQGTAGLSRGLLGPADVCCSLSGLHKSPGVCCGLLGSAEVCLRLQGTSCLSNGLLRPAEAC